MFRTEPPPFAGALALAFASLLTLTSTPLSAHGDHGGGGGGAVLPPGVTLASVDYETVSFRQISDRRLTDLAAAGVEEVHSLKTIAVPALSVGYGLTRNFTIGARLPNLANREIRETDVDEPGVNARGGVYGFGDISLTGTYRFINDIQRGFDATATFGVKAPTGRTSALDKGGELFEIHHQPGSGSWDGLLGGGLSQKLDKVTLSANALYAFAGEGARETRLGDRFNYGVTAAYRLWASGSEHAHPMRLGANFDGMMRHGGVDHAPATSPTGLSPVTTLDISLGLNGQWSDSLRVAGERGENTGGHVLYLTPGARLTMDGWSSYLNIGVPVAREFNGIQSEPKLNVNTGMSIQF